MSRRVPPRPRTNPRCGRADFGQPAEAGPVSGKSRTPLSVRAECLAPRRGTVGSARGRRDPARGQPRHPRSPAGASSTCRVLQRRVPAGRQGLPSAYQPACHRPRRAGGARRRCRCRIQDPALRGFLGSRRSAGCRAWMLSAGRGRRDRGGRCIQRHRSRSDNFSVGRADERRPVPQSRLRGAVRLNLARAIVRPADHSAGAPGAEEQPLAHRQHAYRRSPDLCSGSGDIAAQDLSVYRLADRRLRQGAADLFGPRTAGVGFR